MLPHLGQGANQSIEDGMALATILARTGSQVTMIPEVANHLISSGGKRLRPILTLAMAQLAGYVGTGHIKLAAAVVWPMYSVASRVQLTS